MKKTFIILIILLVVASGFYLFKKEKPHKPEIQTKYYQNNNIGVSFSYPKNLFASTTENIIILHHDIPYVNTGSCDMMGENKTYDRLTDFEMTIRVVEKSLTETVKSLSPYIPQENFVNDELIASPGFIDTYQIGDLKGFAIYEGAEGCGQTTYYFPIETNRTLVVTNASIQALSSAIIKEKVDQVLAVPGVIPREENGAIFQSILKSIKIN